VAVALLLGAPDHVAQLAGLGLRLEYFQDALLAGEQARRSVTENDPKNAAGSQDYFRRMRVLRERLIAAAGYKRADLDGLPLVMNPYKSVAIGVLLGDHQTGWVGPYHPRSRRPLGEKKLKLVAKNQQLAMIPRPVGADEVDLEAAELSGVQTWFFVTYRRVRGERVIVSSELSQPEETDAEGYGTRWGRRIPFPDVTFDGVKPYVDNGAGGSGGYEVAVDEK
jgi:hypothetical protein